MEGATGIEPVLPTWKA